MLNSFIRTSLLGGWLTTLALIVAISIMMGANVSTTALLLALGVAPVIVMALIGAGAPPPTVAEILHAVETKDSRQ